MIVWLHKLDVFNNLSSWVWIAFSSFKWRLWGRLLTEISSLAGYCGRKALADFILLGLETGSFFVTVRLFVSPFCFEKLQISVGLSVFGLSRSSYY